jgi:hypothetical protein
MKKIKKIVLQFFIWFFWKHFHCGLKSVLGHKTLSSSIAEMRAIEDSIRLENNLEPVDKITWGNSKATNRETFAKYVTLKHFNQVGELLALFRAVDERKILKENHNGG